MDIAVKVPVTCGCFDEEQLNAITMIAARRQACKDGSGAHNNKIDPKLSDFGCHYDGMFAEAAVCLELGLPLNRELYRGSDGGIDLVFHGWRLQIKGTHSWRYPIYFNRKEDLKADVAIGVYFRSPSSWVIRGAITREMFRECCEPCNFGYGPRVGVKIEHLVAIEVFKDTWK